MGDILGFLFLKSSNKKVKLSLFGLGQSDPEVVISPAIKRLNGVKLTKYDRRRNIAEVQMDRRSSVTGDELVKTIQSTGISAEVLSLN